MKLASSYSNATLLCLMIQNELRPMKGDQVRQLYEITLKKIIPVCHPRRKKDSCRL
ncbi:Hypothetical protein FKW44_018141 [Caligus rogercresseyi]|uniref:Uncharacterized protein n=1 Tax=Caligus rogercresseyi TaxID=217165 RepID=A0A7T8GTZ3_CALRO|nr:Hypothetical protein FKW44_018141 [Caligus rogercresseyi]